MLKWRTAKYDDQPKVKKALALEFKFPTRSSSQHVSSNTISTNRPLARSVCTSKHTSNSEDDVWWMLWNLFIMKCDNQERFISHHFSSMEQEWETFKSQYQSLFFRMTPHEENPTLRMHLDLRFKNLPSNKSAFSYNYITSSKTQNLPLLLALQKNTMKVGKNI